MAFVVVWEFRVRPVCVNEFVKLYNGEGEWAKLFARGEGFLGAPDARRVVAGALRHHRPLARRDLL